MTEFASPKASVKLRAAAESGRLRDPAVAHQRLGRLRERYWRAASAFEVTITPLPQPTGKARLSITWQRVPRWTDWATLSEGCYLLRTNLPASDPATLWKQYIQLVEAEWAFRITAYAEELLADPKERSEHVMVVGVVYLVTLIA